MKLGDKIVFRGVEAEVVGFVTPGVVLQWKDSSGSIVTETVTRRDLEPRKPQPRVIYADFRNFRRYG